MHGTKLGNARLAWADLGQSDIDGASFANANVTNANFRNARLVGTAFRDADLSGSDLTGAFERGSKSEGAREEGLVADVRDGVRVTADGLGLARLVALMLDKAAIADVLGIHHTRLALIIGRFAP
ncbi:MAG: pentapeptide repeat-containing protein, partial [Alphaproteobacteria bacterium]|nr:pentapeptide repeat-containing protein [Alphaproteobacteria bacterium]